MLREAIVYAGGIYVVRNYFRDRLDEARDKLQIERAAKESLQRRFQQTQDDASYTVLALLPTLSEQILLTLDVESLTDELQSRKNRNNNPPSIESSQSWALEPSPSSSPSSSRPVYSPAPSASASSSMADSIDDGRQSNEATTKLKSKTQLWNELKLLTFTRTLTTLYSTTLLCLLTTLQLTFLARSKYVASILTEEQEERIQEQLEFELTTSNIVLGSFGLGPATVMGSHLEKLLSGADGGTMDDPENGIRGGGGGGGLWTTEGIGEDVESKYLTLSWWLLHVGWKNVSERVQRAVEETLDGVSLKTKLPLVDLHRIIRDIRRRVEDEVVFGGKEKKSGFLSCLLPSTPEMIHHVLSHGHSPRAAPSPSPAHRPLSVTDSPNPPQHLAYIHQPPFSSLLSETRAILSSPSFARALDVSLDYATEILMEGLAKNVFEPHRDPTTIGTTEPRVQLALLLPALSKWSQVALNGFPSELVDRILGLGEVMSLSAVVFSKFEEEFM